MIEQLEQHILGNIDNRVTVASDDELFAGGYLRGHLTLAVAKISEDNKLSAASLDSQVQQSIQCAIAAGELSPADQILVLQLWQNLFHQAKLELEL